MATNEDSDTLTEEERIRAVVRDELDNEVATGEETATRRDFAKAALLGGATLATGTGVGAVGYKEAVQPASAQSTGDGDGDIGTPSDPVDVFGDGISATSVSTDELSLTNHLIYIFSEGGDMVTTVDPDAYANPIQEAWDQAGSTGTIIYPPRNIEYNSTLSGAGGKRHIGRGGPNGTWFIDTDETTPSYQATTTGDESYSFFDGIMWRTKNNPGRSAPVFKFDADVPSWNLGPNMRFRNNSGADLFHFDTGHAWSSVWNNPTASGYNRFLKSDNLDAPLYILAPYLGSDDETTPEFDVNTVGSIFIGHGWNKGNVSCPLLIADGFGNQENPRIFVGRGNFEPNTDNGAIDSVVKVEKAAVADIYGFSLRGGNYTFNNRHIHVHDSRSGIKNIYGGYNQLVVTGDVNNPGVIFHGRSNSTWNETGGLLTEYITCTADVVKKKSTGQGYDGGTDDTRL